MCTWQVFPPSSFKPPNYVYNSFSRNFPINSFSHNSLHYCTSERNCLASLPNIASLTRHDGGSESNFWFVRCFTVLFSAWWLLTEVNISFACRVGNSFSPPSGITIQPMSFLRESLVKSFDLYKIRRAHGRINASRDYVCGMADWTSRQLFSHFSQKKNTLLFGAFINPPTFFQRTTYYS